MTALAPTAGVPPASSASVSLEPAGLPPRSRLAVSLCILCGVALMSLDSAIATLALPTLSQELAASKAATVWVVNGYQVGTAVCLLPAAALGEILGLRRVYSFGLLLFTAASLACALSGSLGWLIAARVVQGVGGACLAAVGPAMIRHIFPRSMIGRGLAMIAMVVAVSGAAGPSIGALVLEVASWPWLFLVNLPIGVLALVLFWVLAPAPPATPRPFDFVGAVLSAVSLGLVVVGVDGLGRVETAWAVGAIVAGLVGLAGLIAQQSRRSDPLVPLDLLAIPLFALSIVTSMCSYAAQILAYVSLPFLLQGLMGKSALATGLLVTPWPLMVAVAAPLAGRLSARWPASVLSSLGLGTLALGLALLATLPGHPSDVDIVWRMALCGLGFGFFQTPNNATLMTAGPVRRSGAAGGMLAVARVSGWCAGSTIVALLLAGAGPGAPVWCLGVAAGLAGVGALVSVSRARV
ncbi:MFS transporter [Pararhodospirillum oryzae]|uniref:Multidrug MFS transporter n=1 Tax=Pararhodospirillum oryzae TaxID=478448 RepID=A0A512H3Z8_9PROT|nr:MFS transporter [Pararhodospirillum oryzae]GEO80161.1 multidrug MFS transporter [Pararhodospirillum oryzae]